MLYPPCILSTALFRTDITASGHQPNNFLRTYLYKHCNGDTRHIRPYLVENTGSRPLSQSQAAKGLISSWVGDDQRIPAVVCFLVSFTFLPFDWRLFHSTLFQQWGSGYLFIFFKVMSNILCLSLLPGYRILYNLAARPARHMNPLSPVTGVIARIRISSLTLL